MELSKIIFIVLFIIYIACFIISIFVDKNKAKENSKLFIIIKRIISITIVVILCILLTVIPGFFELTAGLIILPLLFVIAGSLLFFNKKQKLGAN